MTARAIILGLLAALFIAGFGFINDRVLRLESFTSGHLLAVIAFGGLFLMLAVVNPLLGKIWRKLILRPAELAVMVTMMLVACSIPGRGLMEEFTYVLAMPAHWNRLSTEWRKHKLLDYVPPQALPADGKYDEQVQPGYITGLRKPGQRISLYQVPWAKWQRSLQTWLPLLLLSAACSVCLAMILHKQWSVNERLRYPIADFANSLLQRDAEGKSTILHNRMFWLGLAIILFIRGVNATNAWMDGRFISIPMSFDLRAIGQRFPIFHKDINGRMLLWLQVYPIVIAFSLFLASDISFSMGVCQFLCFPILAYLITIGVDMRTDYELGGVQGWHRAGSYIGMGLILLYTGRQHYWNVLKSAFTFRPNARVAGATVWACRIFLVCLVAMVVLITDLGLAWPLSIIVVLLTLLTFVCVSRVGAETGLFYIQPGWQACGMMLGLFGAYAMGPQGIIIACMVCMVLSADQSMALMPHVTNVLRLCDRVGIRPHKTGGIAMITYILCLAVAVPAVLWACYNWGAPKYGYSYHRIPTVPFRAADTGAAELIASGELTESEKLSPMQRLTSFRPKKHFYWAIGSGVALVALASFLRLRFSWWPIHPLIFVVWTTWPLQVFCHSFLIGWLLKVLVLRFGGPQTYARCKPLMIGVIAGEVLAAVALMGIGGIYYGVTDMMPHTYFFFPR